MHRDLYFIPLMLKACRTAGTESALVDALREIVRRGQQASHRRGYEQFVRWLRVMARTHEDFNVQSMGPDVETPSVPSEPYRLRLYRDDQLLTTLTLGRGGAPTTVDRVRPGHYRLMLETGWVIWKRSLAETDLLWNKAFPDAPLPLAADDGRSPVQTANEQSVAGTGLMIRMTPGLGAGQLTFQLAPFRE